MLAGELNIWYKIIEAAGLVAETFEVRLGQGVDGVWVFVEQVSRRLKRQFSEQTCRESVGDGPLLKLQERKWS